MSASSESSQSSDAQRLEATVRGRVQGVGFRHFTRRTARELGLVGFVRNDPDGTVTVVAEGPRAKLDEFVGALHEGPRSAIVENVETMWASARDDFSDFSVAYH
jgi:acylphosphatase